MKMNVQEKSADPMASMFVSAAILQPKTVFLSKDFWSPWWKFDTLFPSILPRLLPVNQSVQKRGWCCSQSCKTQPTFLEIHGCWHRFPAWSRFFSSHRQIPCTSEIFCLMFFFFLPYFRIAFATPNPPINLTLCYLYRDLRAQCVTTVEFAGSAQTVDIYNPPSSQEPWRMQTKTRLTNTGDPFVVIIVSNKKIHR